MLSFAEIPSDNADLAGIDVDFPHLPADTARSCPVPMADVLLYLGDEVPDGDRLSEEDLRFLRTAQVAERRYWIWAFDEPEGDPAYLTVSADDSGNTCVGYEADYYGLTPEQFMLGDYHNVF